jgi:DNA-binding MarR family transcriptional regulator
VDAATERFIDQFGLLFEQEGFPRIAGRITALLLVSEDARSLDDIAGRLGVSKASVSTDARRLADRGLLVRTRRPGDRKDYYAFAPDGFRTVLAGHIATLHRFNTLLRTAARLPLARKIARGRVRQWTELNLAMSDSMTILLDRWNSTPAAGRRPTSRGSR